MQLLKKDYWFIWLLFYFITGSLAAFMFLGFLLNIYSSKSWYAKWQNWLLGLVSIIGIPIMIIVFALETIIKIAAKLKVSGSEYYESPYIWILMVIIPIFGWMAFMITTLYLEIMILVALYEGKAEKFIKK